MHNRLLNIFLLLTGIAMTNPSSAQQMNPYYNFKHLNVQNGLTQNIVYHFLQDNRGYLWIGTRQGISLFDGSRTINFQHKENDNKSLAGNFITRILEDSHHIVWVGTDKGIDRFNQSDNSFTHFGVPMADGTIGNDYCVPLGFTNTEDLWLINPSIKSICVFNTRTKKIMRITASDAVDGILRRDLSGRVHFWSYLSNGTNHLIFKDNQLVNQDIYLGEQKKTGRPASLIFHVFVQNDTSTWLATADGLIELNMTTGRSILYNELKGERINEIRHISRSSDGTFWLGTGNAGVFTFDPASRQFIDHFANESLDPFSICSNNIVSIYFDRVGNIWCGSYGSGLSYAHVGNNFLSKHLSKTETGRWKKENNISWLGADQQGNIWCMVQNVQGFWKLDASLKLQEFRQPKMENGKPFIAAVYKLLFDRKDRAWCITDRGLFRYFPRTNQIKQVAFQQLSTTLFGSYWINDIRQLYDSSILFSTFGGVFHIVTNGSQESIEPLSGLNKLPLVAYDLIFEDSAHKIYLKDMEGQLHILSEKNRPGSYEIEKSIAFQPTVLQMRQTGADILMATDAGLFELHRADDSIIRLSLNDKLPFTRVSNLLTARNKLWLFGDMGLYQYNTIEKTGRLFSIEDGLPANEFKENSLLCVSSGNCIIGTTNGILSFNPDQTEDIVYPPRAQLINMYVNDSSTGFLPNAQDCSEVTLEHDQNTFSFDYSGINFQPSQSAVFEYRLDGFDENWIRSGNTHYTRYSRIEPGHYTFRIRALDVRGNVSPFVKTIVVIIKKAFWQTRLFKFLLAAVFVLCVWMIIKWYLGMRIRKQQVEFDKLSAIEKERTRIATEMHDDLGAGLSRIKFLSGSIGMKQPSDQLIGNEIASIETYATEMIGKMGEIVWALNERNDSLSDLLSYTRAYATEYLLDNGIECQVNAPPDFPSVFVSGEFRRNIYLTIKEALHNVVKHAGARLVRIDIKIDQGLRISIRDDGAGFDPSVVKPFRNGLSNMQKRMKDIAGTLEITHHNGTLVVLSAPLTM